MDKDTDKTLVVFRKFKNDGEIIALFPELEEPCNGCTSYQHVGQHGNAQYWFVIECSMPAQPHEYADLKAELESIGYNLNVRKRWTRKRGT